MAKIDPEDERRRLGEVYAGQMDGELEQLAVEADALSESAREALRAELVKRGLYAGQLDAVSSPVPDSMEFRNLVTVRTFSNLTEAELAKGLLDAAGIDSFLFDRNIGRIYWINVVGGIKLRVDAQNVDEANRTLIENSSGEIPPDESESTDDNPST